MYGYVDPVAASGIPCIEDSDPQPNLGHWQIRSLTGFKMSVSDYKKTFKKRFCWGFEAPPALLGGSAMKNFLFLFLWSIFGRLGSGSGSATPEQDMKMY
jgi:hypothetical protein